MKQVWADAALSTCSLWSTVEKPEKLWVKNIFVQNISTDFLAELVIPNGLIPLSLDNLFTELDCSKKLLANLLDSHFEFIISLPMA